MKINFVTFNFMGQKHKDLGDVKALKHLNLSGVEVPSKRSACGMSKENGGSKKCYDEFILSFAEMASNVACEEAEKRGINPDDLFQEIMLEITKYAQKHQNATRGIYENTPNRIAKTVAEKYNPEQDEFIRDVNPVDERDLSDVLAQKCAPEVIDRVLDTLSPRERKVIEERFGFYGEPKTLEEVGKTIEGCDWNGDTDIGRGKVWKIEQRALHKLRHPSRSKYLRGFVKAISDGSANPVSTR